MNSYYPGQTLDRIGVLRKLDPRQDERFGETPMAIIHASRAIDPAEIVAWCDARMADYKVPRYIVLEPQPLPRLATGKLAKRELKDRYANAAETLPRVR